MYALIHDIKITDNLSRIANLVRAGHDVNRKDDHGNNPLCVAINARKEHFAIYLLDNGADPNSLDHQGNPALVIAVTHSLTKVTEHLIEKGVLFNNNGRVALYYAVRSGQSKFVELLLKAGCNVNDYNYSGDTPFHLSIKLGNLGIIRMLLDYGADRDLKTKGKIEYSCKDIAKRTLNYSGKENVIALIENHPLLELKEPDLD